MRANMKRQRENNDIDLYLSKKKYDEDNNRKKRYTRVAIMLHVNRRNGNQIESHRYQIKLSCIVAMRRYMMTRRTLTCNARILRVIR